MLWAVQAAAFDARDRWVNQVWREYNRLDKNWPTQNRTAVPRIGDDSIQLAWATEVRRFYGERRGTAPLRASGRTRGLSLPDSWAPPILMLPDFPRQSAATSRAGLDIMTMGISRVASFAAYTARVCTAMITSTWLRTSPAANAGGQRLCAQVCG
jgi:hypothetical protein